MKFPSLIGLRKTRCHLFGWHSGGAVSIPHRIEKNQFVCKGLAPQNQFPSLIGLRKTEDAKDAAVCKPAFPSLIGLRKTNPDIVFQGYRNIKAFFARSKIIDLFVGYPRVVYKK